MKTFYFKAIDDNYVIEIQAKNRKGVKDKLLEVRYTCMNADFDAFEEIPTDWEKLQVIEIDKWKDFVR